ncbi:hypothetical protein FisN_6Hh084 [Fistulifera solaris]|uniref:Endoplasmic reticulum oxidoreductin 1 n=1 Tax=Fistulifera solaris TaxID=1519565 RepID=A0A1Z5KIU8_FISSO|nr:hypothetical protein FisN_6Hh084 [Fistulifera solaris]|eukprot:GAX25878.1 hypothetical protein FisN_6Hh084 [Fistulifera solaris]
MVHTTLLSANGAFLLLTILDVGRGFVVPKCSSRATQKWSAKVSSNEYLMPGMQAIDASNEELFHKLESLREKPSFRFFSVDILASCEYMPQELFECYTESCEIYPAEEEEVSSRIREVDRQEHAFDLDGWTRWDMPSDDYYDLEAFPEGYTEYDGSEIWKFIHNRICFDGYDYDDEHWKADFNKAVSGLHSMISAQVLRGVQEKMDEGEVIQLDLKKEFTRRLGANGETPRAIENLYFCFMLLLTAVSRAKARLLSDCSNGNIESDASEDLRDIFNSPLLNDASVSLAAKRLQDHATQDGASSQNLWEARMRSRELLRITNCVQCNKCRLHGKISILGLTTALQILVGPTGRGLDPEQVKRVELSALVTTLHKCSRAIQYCQQMQ